jgi:hypothetical protein
MMSRRILFGMMMSFPLAVLPAGKAAAAPYEHVLLISVDGMHALDMANFIAAHPASTLASLAQTGAFYPNAFAPVPTDSFPGLLALVSGGTPKSTGVFYDDSFDRSYFEPGSNCSGAAGAEVSFAENIDVDSKRLDAGGKIGDPKTQIDPAKLPMALIDGKCTAVYPHSFVRVNNIFEVVKSHNGRTAWSDKHPAYERSCGRSATIRRS